MERAILAFTNLVDAVGVTLSADSEAGPDLVVANLANETIQRPWRSSAGNAWFQVDLGADHAAGVIAFAVPRDGMMIGAADTVRLQLDADGGTPGTGAVYDSGAAASGIDPLCGYWLKFFSTPPVWRYARITIATANPYVQVGRLWAAAYLQPKRNFSYDWSRQWLDGGVNTYGPRSGVRFSTAGPRRRRLALAFASADAADAAAMEDGDIVAGKTSQILVCTNPEAPARTTIFGAVTEPSPITQVRFPIYTKPYDVLEDL